MKLIDVHAHLDHERFRKDLDKIIERFKKFGGKFIITSGVNAVTNRKALEIAKKYDTVKVSFGIYPIDALMKEFDVDEELVWIEKHADDCVAIGEVGLDYNWDKFQTEKMRKKQKEVFAKVIDLAKRIGKPLVIHSRKAELDAIEMLEEAGCDKVVMHCFNGKKALIRRCIENGWYFSVPPVITRIEHFKMLVKTVPLEQLLTETDAPFLSPVVGGRNESANVAITIKEIAKIKRLSEEDVARQIFINAVKLFRL